MKVSNTMSPPKPDRAFMVNDIVRLARGWTPMTISYIHPSGDITAYYGIQEFDPKGERYPNVMTSGYTRRAKEFVWWDGETIPGRNQPMTRRFSIKNCPENKIGTFRGITGNGLSILEFEDQTIECYHPSEIMEVMPFTFATKTMNPASNMAYWSFEDPEKRVSVGDILVSDTDGLLKVYAVDTRTNKTRVFTGRKLITSDI